MQLTLRTLLAYLDDTLKAAEAHDIGNKVAANPQARELIERIKKAISKRSLSVPVSQKANDAADPNLIALYLSDALPPEQVAEFEKICLKQDVHLAEVAACHQMLTLLQSEQIRIPPSTRRRMYDLAPAPLSLANRKPGKAVSVVSIYDESNRAADDTADAAYLMGLGAMSREEPKNRQLLRLGVAVALIAMLGLSLFMVWPGGMISTQEPVSYASLVPSKQDKLPVKVQDAKSQESGLPAVPVPMPGVNIPEVAVVPVLPGQPSEIAPEPRPSGSKPNDPTPSTEPKREDPALADFTRTLPPASQDTIIFGKLERRLPGAIVVSRNATDGEVKLLDTDDATIYTAERYTVLPGYKAIFRANNDLQIECWSNLPDLASFSSVRETTFTPTVALPGYDLDLSLLTGRFYISAKKPNGSKIVLRLGELIWDLTLQDDKTEIAVEVSRQLVPSVGEVRYDLGAGMYVLQGKIELALSNTKKETFTRGDEIFWNSTTKTSRSKRNDANPLDPGIYWSKFTTATDADRTKNLLSLLEELHKNVVASGNLRAAVSEFYQDREVVLNAREELRATTAVEMFGAMQDLRGLASALNDPKRPWVRARAYQSLRQVFALNPSLLPEFRTVLLDNLRLSEDNVDRTIRLLRGFPAEELADISVLGRLVEDLDVTNPLAVPVRECAFQQLVVLLDPSDIKSRELFFYDAAATPASRAAMVTLWKKKLEEWKAIKAMPPVPQP